MTALTKYQTDIMIALALMISAGVYSHGNPMAIFWSGIIAIWIFNFRNLYALMATSDYNFKAKRLQRVMRKFTNEDFGQKHYADCEIYYLNSRDELRKVSFDAYRQMEKSNPIEDLPQCILVHASGYLWGEGFLLKFRGERNFWELNYPREIRYGNKFIGIKDMIGDRIDLSLSNYPEEERFGILLKFVSEFHSVRNFEAKQIARYAVPKLLKTKQSMGASENIERVRIALEISASQGILNGMTIDPYGNEDLESSRNLLSALPR